MKNYAADPGDPADVIAAARIIHWLVTILIVVCLTPFFVLIWFFVGPFLLLQTLRDEKRIEEALASGAYDGQFACALGFDDQNAPEDDEGAYCNTTFLIEASSERAARAHAEMVTAGILGARPELQRLSVTILPRAQAIDQLTRDWAMDMPIVRASEEPPWADLTP